MKKPSFAKLKDDLERACADLRLFTLGKWKARHGALIIGQVSTQCDRLEKLFGTGPNAREAATLVISVRFRIKAAESRLELLRDR